MPTIDELEHDSALETLAELAGALETINLLVQDSVLVLARANRGGTVEAKVSMALQRGRQRGLDGVRSLLDDGSAEGLERLFAEAFQCKRPND